MTPSKFITVLLAEDHVVVREGLCSILEAEGDIKVIGQAGDGRLAVELCEKLRPSVVVMDIAMPRLNGLEATRQILKKAPDTRILVLSAHNDSAYVNKVIALGAAGYLVKQTSHLILAKAIREACKGNSFFSPSIAKRLQDQKGKSGTRRNAKSGKADNLTSREVEVLQLIAEGKANKETAFELGLALRPWKSIGRRL